MSERKDVKIFIASSGELSDERKESVLILTELNKRFPHLHLEPVLYELDTSSGNNPGKVRIQDEINPLLIKSQIVVVLFYSQVGKFTKEEFELAKKEDKKIFLYLKEGFHSDDPDKIKKYLELMEMRKKIEEESSIRYEKYNSIKNFNGLLYKDLDKYISEKYAGAVFDSFSTTLLNSNVSNKLSHFPIPKKYFTGRDTEISEFKKAIDNGNTLIAVDGSGGIGKTQFVSRCIEMFIEADKVIWYECTIASQMDTLISEAGYPNLLKGTSKTDREKFSAFKDKIQENGLFLFLDNFQQTNNNHVFKDFLMFIQDYLKKGCVIVIDRDDIRSVNLSPKRIHIEGFKENKLEYAKTLIAHCYKDDIKINDLELEKLCGQLQGYPLAIDFALLLLSEGVTPIDIINKIIQEGQGEEISERLLNAIFSREDASQEEKDFITQFSVFTRTTPEKAVIAVISELLVKVAPRKLQKKNLLTFSEGNYQIHPLVREFCYNKLVDRESVHLRAAEYFIAQRATEFSSALEEYIFFHLEKSKQWDRINKEIKEKGRQFILLGQLGLVKELLEKLSKVAIRCPLFDILNGDIYEIQGKWEEAKKYFESAILNTEDKRVKAEGIIKMGEILFRTGAVRDSLVLFQDAYGFSKKNRFLKEEARALNDIGLVNEFFGDLDLASKNLSAAFKIREQIVDKEGMAATLTNMGNISFKKGKYNKSVEQNQDSLKISAEIGDTISTGVALCNIGLSLSRKGESSEALIKYEESLVLSQTVGSKSCIATSLNNIGTIYASQKKYDDAKIKYEESLRIKEEIGDTLGISTSLHNIGVLLSDKNINKYYEAIIFFFRALSISNKIEAKPHTESTIRLLVEMREKFLGLEKFRNLSKQAYQEISIDMQKYIPLQELLKEPVYHSEPRLGRNDPCACGSGKKFKRCHGLN